MREKFSPKTIEKMFPKTYPMFQEICHNSPKKLNFGGKFRSFEKFGAIGDCYHVHSIYMASFRVTTAFSKWGKKRSILGQLAIGTISFNNRQLPPLRS